MPTPIVSACIPAYNHARFIRAAIESVLAQTYRDFELVVADDGSTDGTYEIACEYERRFPGVVRVVTHPGHRNAGISPTADLAFESAVGVYWAPLASDDWWYPRKLERQMARLEGNSGIDLAYGLLDVVDEHGHRASAVIGADITRAVWPFERLLQGNVIPATSVVARREAIYAVGLHDSELAYQDWEMWLRLVAKFSIAFLPQSLGAFRLHDRNTSLATDRETNIGRMIAVLERLRTKASTLGGALEGKRSQAAIDLQLAYLRFCLGQRAVADAELSRAFETDPTLAADVRYVAEWLRRRALNELHPNVRTEAYSAAADRLRRKSDGHPDQVLPNDSVAIWFLRAVPPGLSRRLQSTACAAQEARAALENWRSRRWLAALRDACRAVGHDPGLVGAGARTLSERRGQLWSSVSMKARLLATDREGRG